MERALIILEALVKSKKPQSLHELAKSTGYYKSTILRLSNSLIKFGYLRREEDGRYVLGPSCSSLGSAHAALFDFRVLVQKQIERLAEESSETVSFYVRDGETRVCILRQNSERPVRHHVDEGARLPLNLGAAGMVLRAYSGEMGEELDRVRQDGYAVSVGQRDPDAAAVSVPIFDGLNQLKGALTISGLRSRFTYEATNQFRIKLLEAKRRIETELGRSVAVKRGTLAAPTE